MKAYRLLTLEISDNKVDALFGKATTLASVASMIYRILYMPKDTIGRNAALHHVWLLPVYISEGLIPRTGYTTSIKHSMLACKFMDYQNLLREEQGLPLIHHARNFNRQEWVLGKHSVDGFVPESGKPSSLILFYVCLC